VNGWQIHFTARDLAQIQIAPTLGPFAETLFALSLLRCPVQRPPAFGGWRGQVGGRLTAEMNLADATQASYRALVEPYWPRARAGLEAERARRGRVLMEGGVDLLLNTLQPPMIRWCPPRLEIHFPVRPTCTFRWAAAA
jgi:hypothetical protein